MVRSLGFLQLSKSKALSPLIRHVRRLHHDQRGAVSLETILVVGAVALPILIFILKFGWPRIRDYFSRNMQVLNNESNSVSGAQ